MELKQLEIDFAVCKLYSTNNINLEDDFVFLCKTDDEISLVCPIENIPADASDVEKNWKGLKISGILDFGTVGIIAKISNILAKQKISIFVVSTFNTDYIFLKGDFYLNAVRVLRNNGYTII